MGPSTRRTVIKLMIDIFALHSLISYIYIIQVYSYLLIKAMCVHDCALNTSISVAINKGLENNFYITKIFPNKLLCQLYQSKNEQFYSMHAYVLAYMYIYLFSIPVRGQIKGFDRSLNQLQWVDN